MPTAPTPTARALLYSYQPAGYAHALELSRRRAREAKARGTASHEGGRPVAPILVIIGPPGTGKTTLGLALAAALRVSFADGDDLHPPANIAKMSAGVALADADRGPWLDAIGAVMDGWIAAGRGGVVACSALKRAYRKRLAHGRRAVRFVHPTAEPALLRERVARRRGHFMPPALLDDQLRVFEPPSADEAAIVVPAALPTAAQAEAVIAALDDHRPAP